MASEKLFELIHSMTMSEKRYFKIFSTKHVIGEENNYVKLFSLIDQQSTYNEQAVRSAAFVKNSSAEKNYLYHLIIKSLSAFHSDLNSKTKIYTLLQNVEMLYHKGLYDHCTQLIKRARVLAEKKELFVQLLAINEMEIELFSKRFDYKNALETMENRDVIIDKMSNFAFIQKTTTQAYFDRIQKGTARSQTDLEIIKSYVDRQEISDSNFAQSKRAELYQLSLKTAHSYFANDKEKILEYAGKNVDHYEAWPFLIEFSTIGYLSSLNNLIYAQLENGLIKELYQTISKLENCPREYQLNNSPVSLSRVFIYANNLKLLTALKQGEILEGVKLGNEIEKERKQHLSLISAPLLYDHYLYLTILHFINGDYKIALRYSNEILNDVKFKMKDDLLSMIRLVNLLIHFELGNAFSLVFLTQSVYQFLRRRKRDFKVEKVMIKFMTQYDKLNSVSEKKEAFLSLYERLENLKKEALENRPFLLFDLSKWAAAKAKGKTLFEMYD